MKRHPLIFIVLILTSGCYHDVSEEENSIDSITTNQYPLDNWQLIKEINFVCINDEDTLNWANINKPDTNCIVDGSSKVLVSKAVKLHIDYPLNVTATFIIKSDTGFSRIDLIKIISEKYHKIYDEEKLTSKIGGREVERVSGTSTKYGICCHDIIDLDLSSIKVYTDVYGVTNITLDVES